MTNILSFATDILSLFWEKVGARDQISHATVPRKHENMFLLLSSVAPIIIHYYWNWKSPKWWTKYVWTFPMKRTNPLSSQLIIILQITKQCFFLLLLWKRKVFFQSNSEITICVVNEVSHLCRLPLLGWWMTCWLAHLQWALFCF